MRWSVGRLRYGSVHAYVVSVWLCATVFAASGLCLLVANGARPAPSAAVALFFPSLGAWIVLQHPSNVIGWIFGLAGFTGSLTLFTVQYAQYGLVTAPGSVPGAILAGWLGYWLWVPAVGLVGTVCLLFPDGRLPSLRWWPVLVMVVGGLLSVASGMALRPWGVAVTGLYEGSVVGLAARATPFELPSYPGENPLAGGSLVFSDVLLGVGGALMLVGWFGSIAALLFRFRRGSRTQRQQLKILVFVLALLPAAHMVTLGGGGVSGTVTAFNVVLLAVAIAIAIVRHHLFDIDAVIRRTVTYSAVTVLLAGIYSLSVVTIAPVVRLTTGARDSEFVVAASTLAVAAAFNPVRRRLLELVSRHFQRTAYDANQIVERYGQRLRLDGDLHLLADELCWVVAGTMRPISLSLWMPSSRLPGWQEQRHG